MSKNVVLFEHPKRVNFSEWGAAHPDCDSLILRENDDSDGTVVIVAYARNNDGNKELMDIIRTRNDLDLLCGLDSWALNSIGGLY